MRHLTNLNRSTNSVPSSKLEHFTGNARILRKGRPCTYGNSGDFRASFEQVEKAVIVDDREPLSGSLAPPNAYMAGVTKV